MATILVGPNNNIPLVVGGQYELTPGYASTDWVEITHVGTKNVHAVGIDDNIADLIVPIWKFDDLIVNYIIEGVLFNKNDYPYDILTEDGRFYLDL